MHKICQIIATTGLTMLEMASYAQQHRAPVRPAFAPSLTSQIRRKTIFYVYGEGLLWNKTTGINAEKGIEIRDRRLIAALVSDLRLSTFQPLDADAASRSSAKFPSGEIDVITPFAQLSYEPSTGREMGMITQPANGLMVSLRPGHERHFLGIIRILAKKAHAHSRSIFLYDVPSS